MTNYLIKQKTPQIQPQEQEEPHNPVQAQVIQNNIPQDPANIENPEPDQPNSLPDLIKFRDCLTVLINNQEKLSLTQTIFRLIAKQLHFSHQQLRKNEALT